MSSARFQALAPREHFLLRPARDVGAVEAQPRELWIHEGGKAVHRSVLHCQALKKMFDEVVQNACDNAVDAQRQLPRTKVIAIELYADRVVVGNDGSTIPIEKHEAWDDWIASVIFSHFGSGSNFDDDQERQGAGMNG